MDKDDFLPAEEISRHYNVEISFITSLRERGLLDLAVVEEKYYIAKTQIRDLEKILYFHQELDINLEGVEAITHMLKQMEALQEKLNALQNRLRIYEL